MKWEDFQSSQNVEDRRGQRKSLAAAGASARAVSGSAP